MRAVNVKGEKALRLKRGLCWVFSLSAAAALAGEVVVPREQLGDVAAFCPSLADFTHCGKWIYEDSLKDEYLADRLRWQFWTMRYE